MRTRPETITKKLRPTSPCRTTSAFAGARPYHAAFERGVKIIGATSHYVTAELDAGPIIEQDVVRVNHEHSVDDLVRKGRDLEKVVFARAIWNHINHNILVYQNRTYLFD